MKNTILLLIAALAVAGCASPAREGRGVVSIKPNASAVTKPVQETRKAVAAATASVTTAQTATTAAKALAAKTAEARALNAELDKIEFTLNLTQIELTSALKAITDSERAIAVLEAQIKQQTAELSQLVIDYNGLATEKRAAEVANAEGKMRERILWRFLVGAIVVAVAEGGVIFLLIKRPFPLPF